MLNPLRRSYTGEWSEGAKNGEGKYVCKSGVVYDGRWKDDCRHGFGIINHPPAHRSIYFCMQSRSSYRHLLVLQRRRLQGKMAIKSEARRRLLPLPQRQHVPGRMGARSSVWHWHVRIQQRRQIRRILVSGQSAWKGGLYLQQRGVVRRRLGPRQKNWSRGMFSRPNIQNASLTV